MSNHESCTSSLNRGKFKSTFMSTGQQHINLSTWFSLQISPTGQSRPPSTVALCATYDNFFFFFLKGNPNALCYLWIIMVISIFLLKCFRCMKCFRCTLWSPHRQIIAVCLWFRCRHAGLCSNILLSPLLCEDVTNELDKKKRYWQLQWFLSGGERNINEQKGAKISRLNHLA